MALREVIERLCVKQLGRLPDLKRPQGYNDKIQWLKLHDQRAKQVTACDKIAVRDMVAAAAGEEILIPASTGWPHRSYPCVAKCNHDSGSATVIRSAGEAGAAYERLSARLSRPYGVDKGEWAYALIEPKIIVEEPLPGPVVDYKFHCVHGHVRWVQVIWGRASGKASEAIFTPAGSVTALHMDEKMVHHPDQAMHPGSEAWDVMIRLAERLAAPWRYVRVDLYWTGRPWFGELTFWPRAGCYRSAHEPIFGEMLDIDLTEKLEPIVA